MLKSEADLNNGRNSLFVCPCTDLGCGAISLKIERQDDIVIWSDFGTDDVLEYRTVTRKYEGLGTYYFNWKEYEEVMKSAFLFGEPDYWHSSKWT